MRLGPSSAGSLSFLKEGNTEYGGVMRRAEHLTSLVATLNSQEAIWHSTCIKVNALPPKTARFLNSTFSLFDKAIKKLSMLPLLNLNPFPSWNLYQNSKQSKWEHFTYQEKRMFDKPVRLGRPAAAESSHLVRDFLCCHSASVQADSRSTAESPSAPRPPARTPSRQGSQAPSPPLHAPLQHGRTQLAPHWGEETLPTPGNTPSPAPYYRVWDTADVPAGRWSLSKLSWLTLVGKGRQKTSFLVCCWHE